MCPHIWRKRSNFTIGGYMWIVLNQANILKRHSGAFCGLTPAKSTTYTPISQGFPKTLLWCGVFGRARAAELATTCTPISPSNPAYDNTSVYLI